MKKIFCFAILFSLLSTMSSAQGFANNEYKVTDFSPPSILGVLNGKLYITAQDSLHGNELYSYDGNHRPELVRDLMPDASDGFSYTSYQNAAVCNGALYFAGNTSLSGYELMKMDSDELFTTVGKNTYHGANFSYPEYITELNGKIYFRDESVENGYELFVYDPVTDTISLVADIALGDESSFPQALCVSNGRLYFKATINAFQQRLYCYDPNDKTTTLLPGNKVDFLESAEDNLMKIEGNLFFTGSNEIFGQELYYYNGLDIERCTDVNEGEGNGVAYFSPLFKNEIYFSGSNGSTGYQLYTFNPTSRSITLKHTLNPRGDGMAKLFTLHKDRLYFSAFTGRKGVELWVTDGASTQKLDGVEALYAGRLTEIMYISVWNEKLYITTSDGENNYALFECTPEARIINNVFQRKYQ